MKKYLFLALAVLTLAFVACNKKDKNEPESNPDTSALTGGKWVYEMDANNYLYFEFTGTTFKYHEVSSALGLTLDAWMGGTYTLSGNTLTLSFTETNIEEMKDELDKYPTEATLDGDQLIYDKYTFTYTE